MAKLFAELRKDKKKRQEKLQAKIKKEVDGEGGDDRFWKLSVDKDGNGYAIIRFLPAPVNEDSPYVKLYDHFFKGPGGFYAEKSLTTLKKGTPDPVSEYNRKIWDSGENGQDWVRKNSKRRLSYISNIYIVDDPANPDNNGKVFLFRYGAKIFDFIKNAIDPKFADETSFEPFCLEEGADLKLRAIQDGEYRSYARSTFMPNGEIADKDGKVLSFEEQEAVWKSEHGLFEFIDPESFKTYDELKAQLDKVLELGDEHRGGHDHDDDVVSGKLNKSRKSKFDKSDDDDDVDEDEEFMKNFNQSSDNDDVDEDDESEFFKELKDLE